MAHVLLLAWGSNSGFLFSFLLNTFRWFGIPKRRTTLGLGLGVRLRVRVFAALGLLRWAWTIVVGALGLSEADAGDGGAVLAVLDLPDVALLLGLGVEFRVRVDQAFNFFT